MGLNQISTQLRTIHNGSNAVVKAQVNVPAGGELTLPAVVADQLQRDNSAFKDGKPTVKNTTTDAPPAVVEAPADVPVVPAEPVVPAAVVLAAKKPAAKTPAKK